jgi:membrane fusion protein (multidrug efflux system)
MYSKLSKRNLLILMPAIIALLMSWVFAKADKSPDKNQASAILVEVTIAKNGFIPKQVESVGSLKAMEEVNISSEVDGRVTQIFFKDGQFVAKDMPIIQLDNIKTKADLESAQTTLQLSKTTYERYQALYKEGGVSQQELDQQRSDVESKEAAVKNAIVALNQKQIPAPFDGELGAFAINEGAYINKGDTLVKLVNKRKLKVEYAIPEFFLPQLKIGQPVLISVDSYPGQTFAGQVTFIAPSIDKLTRTVSVQATVPNEEGNLSPGMFVHISQIISEQRETIVIPEQAVTASLQGYTVFKVIDGKAILTKVAIGERYNGMIEIKQGLAVGDTIVIAGQQKLDDGTAVTIKKDSNAQAKP